MVFILHSLDQGGGIAIQTACSKIQFLLQGQSAISEVESTTGFMPSTSISTSTALVVGAVAIGIPVLARMLRSPVTLVLCSPLIIAVAVLAIPSLAVVAAYYADRARQRSTPALRHAARPLAFATPAAWSAVLTRSQWVERPVELSPLRSASLDISRSADDILWLVIRDFVQVWYKQLSTSPEFPASLQQTIHNALDVLIARVVRLDLPAFVVRRILPLLTVHVERFRASEMALRGTRLERHLTQSEELDLLFASRYAGRARLHPAVENLSSNLTRQSEDAHLRKLVDKALPFLLPPDEAGSKAVRIVAREIVACAVFPPIIDMLSDPDFWNQILDRAVRCHIHTHSSLTLFCRPPLRFDSKSLFLESVVSWMPHIPRG